MSATTRRFVMQVGTWSRFKVEFEAVGEEDADPESHLLGTLAICGVSHHLEAFAVKYIGVYTPLVMAESRPGRPQRLLRSGADGHLQTVEINGRDYVLFLSPFSQ